MAININVGAAGVKGVLLDRAFWSRTNKIVLSRTVTLPLTPTDGDIYIIRDDDLTNPNKVAFWSDDAADWLLLTPEEGWVAYVNDDNENVQFSGSAWVAFSVSGTGDFFGPASSTNNALVLFDGITGKLAKDSAITVSTDGTFAGNSDSLIPTQKAVKTYADALIAANDAMVFKGVQDCSGNPNYPAADRGWTYRVSVAGKIGGASGINVEVGDMFICLDDGTSSGTQAAQGSHWSIIQANLDGAVINTRQIIAGAGMTGGGDLSADRTLAMTTDQRTRDIFYIVDGGGATIATGIKGDVQIDFACTIISATLLADQSGSIVVNIWKDTYANFPPDVTAKITASAPPTISTATKSTDSTLTGWTTSIAAGDILRFNVDSVTTITRCVIILKVRIS